jgi:nucleoside 2-deoxyribosyltransferase
MSFDTGSRLPLRVFLACPITGQLLPSTGTVKPEYRRFVEGLRHTILTVADSVFLAFEREDWGHKLMAGDKCAPLDFREMQRCDLVVAYPGTSCGVAVELGWASALGKPIVLLLADDVSYSPLVEGLPTIADVERILLSGGLSDEDLFAVRVPLVQALRRLAARDSTRCQAPGAAL